MPLAFFIWKFCHKLMRVYVVMAGCRFWTGPDDC